MRTVPFKNVLDAILRRHGLDPSADLPQDTGLSILEYINQRVKTGWEIWDWPETMKVEQRAFRNAYDDTLAYNEGDEVWWPSTDDGDDEYHRALVTTTPGQDPSDIDKWEVFTPDDRYIPLDQDNQTAIGQTFGIFAADPRLNVNTSYHSEFRIRSGGISVPTGLGSVWVYFQAVPPEFTLTPPVGAKDYVKGELIYISELGECYKALDDTSDDPVESGTPDPDVWEKVDFPAFLAQYVKAGAYADGKRETDDSERDPVVLQIRNTDAALANQEADDALQREVDKLYAQGHYRKSWYRSCSYAAAVLLVSLASCFSQGSRPPIDKISQLRDVTTVGKNIAKLPNPSATTFLQLNADNTVSALSAAAFRSAIGAGSGGGDASTNTSSSVDSEIALFSGTSGKTLKRGSGTGLLKITSGVASTITDNSTNWDTSYTDRLKWDGGATGLTASTGRTSLGATTVGSNLFTLTNPSAVRYPRINADNTVTAVTAATVLSEAGASPTPSTTARWDASGNLGSVSTPTGRGINDVWIAIRSDGQTGDGTQNEPFDGSGLNFDSIRASIPNNTHIHLEAGTYLTNGWELKEGWIITGRGIDKTIIKLNSGVANTAGDQAAVLYRRDFSGFYNYNEVSDLTLDTNPLNQAIYTGSLNGYLEGAIISAKSAKIHNVKLIGAYAKPGEGFPLSIQHDGSTGQTRQITVTTTSGSAAIVATSGTFATTDVNTPVVGLTRIPWGTTLASRTDSTHATMSANATSTGSVVITIGTSDYAEITGCQVIDPIGYMTCLMVFDQNNGYVAGSTRDNLVTNATKSGSVVGMGARNVRHYVFERNVIIGTNSGSVIDTGNFYDVTYKDNYMSTNPATPGGSGGHGIVFNGSGDYELSIENNYIETASDGGVPLVSASTPASVIMKIDSNRLIAGNVSYAALTSVDGTNNYGIITRNVVSEAVTSTFTAGHFVVNTNIDETGTLIYGGSGSSDLFTDLDFTGADTSYLPDATNRRYVTDAQRTVITTLGSVLTNSTALDFGNTGPSSYAQINMTVTGAAVGDPAIIAPAFIGTAANAVTATVTATDTVTVTFLNTSVVAVNPASTTFKVKVFK